MLKLIVVLSVTFASGLSIACTDPGAYRVPTQSLLKWGGNNTSFAKCVAKLEDVGVDPSVSKVWRKDRAENDTGPIIYSYLFIAKDGENRPVRLRLDYNLPKHAFRCGPVSYTFPKGSCF